MRGAAPATFAVAGLLLGLTPGTGRAADLPVKNVLLLGDSVPYGSACHCQAFGSVYSQDVAASNQWSVSTTNLAKPGATSQDVRVLLNTAAAQAAVRRASTVLIMVGANDFEDPFARDLQGACSPGCYDTVAEHLRLRAIAIVQTIRRIHPTLLSVVVLDYWDVVKDGSTASRLYGAQGQAKSQTATTYANTALHMAANATHSSYVSTRVAFRGPSNNQDPSRLLAADGDHPNAAGHVVIARALTSSRPRG